MSCWEDVLKSSHERAFGIEAQSSPAYLQVVKGTVERAIRDGLSIEEFRRHIHGLGMAKP
jgi:hypothetical protein